MRHARFCLCALVVFPVLASSVAWAADAEAFAAAAASIRVEDLKRHIHVLADDTYEGREAGSRGGRAAGGYLVGEFQRLGLVGAGSGGSFYQVFQNGYRNILAMLPGSDPQLADQVILVGAHYDHVGYGNAQNSYGPWGRIHNGADDNASGTATVVEVAEAFTRLPNPPRRSILFALWDGEEKGLLGSKHWLANPTIPLGRIVLSVNLDMVGRLRNDKIDVYGTRTSLGLRRLVSEANEQSHLRVNYSWEVKDDSDHHPFFERGIPILMLHTGLHSDYHRPSDDVERIELDGMHRIARLMFLAVLTAADEEARPKFRAPSRSEGEASRRRAEAPLAPLPPRLGVRFDPQVDPAGGVRIARVEASSPAARAGLRDGDRLVRLAGEPVTDLTRLRQQIWAAEAPLNVTVLRGAEAQPVDLAVALGGSPVKLGISWREDPAQPGAVVLTRVVPGTLAEAAGLHVNDYLYAVNGQSFANAAEFLQLLKSQSGSLELRFDRAGQLGTATIALAPPSVAAAQ